MSFLDVVLLVTMLRQFFKATVQFLPQKRGVYSQGQPSNSTRAISGSCFFVTTSSTQHRESSQTTAICHGDWTFAPLLDLLVANATPSGVALLLHAHSELHPRRHFWRTPTPWMTHGGDDLPIEVRIMTHVATPPAR